MKERPILFSAPMVRAILDGSKTQTRRVAPISSFDIRQHDEGMVTWRVAFSKPVKGTLASHSGGKFSTDQACRIVASQFCPYGQPGDRLWVRECFSPYEHRQGCWYWADGRIAAHDCTKPKPSIHMPRWASRITLEITGVRVVGLQDISRGDAMSEGCPFPNMAHGDDPRRWYAELWAQINGPSSWSANPWVWVVEFKRLEAA